MNKRERRAIKWKSRKPWREKLENPQERKIVPVPENWRKQFGTGTMLVPRPLDVDSLIREIPRGKLATFPQLRVRLAAQFGADTCCPLTSGIFLRISAEAAEEDLVVRGKSLVSITPYWRVIKEDGSLIEKFPQGGEIQRTRLEEEGSILEKDQKGRYRVKDFQKFLHEF